MSATIIEQHNVATINVVRDGQVWLASDVSTSFSVSFGIDAADNDVMRSRAVEQEVLDQLDEPASR